MRNIFQGQKDIPPRYTGRELFNACVSSGYKSKTSTDVDINTLAARPRSKLTAETQKPRLLITGSRIDRNNLFNMVEDAGGLIVVPDFCNGLKRYSRWIDPSLPPFQAIAQGYLNGPFCARMPGIEDRLERIKELVHDYQIDGIIYHRLKTCDFGLFETPKLENFLEQANIPLLVLETDYILHDAGRIRTRIEAFMEMLENESS